MEKLTSTQSRSIPERSPPRCRLKIYSLATSPGCRLFNAKRARSTQPEPIVTTECRPHFVLPFLI